MLEHCGQYNTLVGQLCLIVNIDVTAQKETVSTLSVQANFLLVTEHVMLDNNLCVTGTQKLRGTLAERLSLALCPTCKKLPPTQTQTATSQPFFCAGDIKNPQDDKV
jgi:hypothetical protein